jgi:hypothetical protein
MHCYSNDVRDSFVSIARNVEFHVVCEQTYVVSHCTPFSFCINKLILYSF